MLAFFRKKRQNLPLCSPGFPTAFPLSSSHLDILSFLFLPVLNNLVYPDRSQDDPEMDGSHRQKQTLKTQLWPSDVLSCISHIALQNWHQILSSSSTTWLAGAAINGSKIRFSPFLPLTAFRLH